MAWRGTKARMLRGELDIADDPDLGTDHLRAAALLDRFNGLPYAGFDERDRVLRELLGEVAGVPARVLREIGPADRVVVREE